MDEEIIRLIWKCPECEDVVISYSHLRCQMNTCECGKTAVDLEQHYQRNIGSPKEVSRKIKVGNEWKNLPKKE